MSVQEEMKASLITAMKAHDEVRKNVLRVALGEIETAESKSAKGTTEEQNQNIVRKLIASNCEVITGLKERNTNADKELAAKLESENSILNEFVPQLMSRVEIRDALDSCQTEVIDAKSDGQATGIAMRELRQKGVRNASGADVSEVVKEMRSG